MPEAMALTESGRRVFVLFALATLLALSTGAAAPATGNASPRISCFIIGKTNPGGCPFTSYFNEDPLFDYGLEPIPPDLPAKEKRKIDRLYFPRTRKALLETYDVIIFSDARVQHFTPRQLDDLEYAFRKAGMTSFSSFGPSWIHAFEPTTLYYIVPISEYTFYFPGSWRVVFRRERDPVLTPFTGLGVENVRGSYYGRMKPRQGTVVWADMEPLNLPWLVSWRPGGKEAGIAWACADEFNADWWALSPGMRGTNPYAIDLTANLMLYSRGMPLITDIQARRAARTLISGFMSQKLLVLSMMDWADLFGANTFSLSRRLTSLEAGVAKATSRYLEQDYGETVSIMRSLSSTMTEISRDAVSLKNQALFWVFLSEWLAVTSAAILAGIVVWTLMIRKAMYRSVEITRLRLI